MDKNDKGDYLTLDLSAHQDFVKGGKCIDNGGRLKVETEDRNFNHATFNTVRGEFFKTHPKYQDYLTVFSLNITTNIKADVLALTQGVGNPNVFVFPLKLENTLAHEVHHGMGLQHIYHDIGKEVLFSSGYKYIFKIASTANLLDNAGYNEDKRCATFYWQWKMLNQNIRK